MSSDQAIVRIAVGIILFVLAIMQVHAQENIGIFQAGYSMGLGSTGIQPTGFKINTSWEFQPAGDKWTMGGSLGYMRISGSESGNDYGVTAVPLCFVSRMMFGGETFKFFVRGQAGTHVSSISYSGSLLSKSDAQIGMVAGLGGGVMFYPSEKTFVSAEYEWLWYSNAFTNTGSIGTASFGVGFRF